VPRCDLAVELDRPDASYRPGERITGVVRAHSALGARCRRLSVAAAWKTSEKVSDGKLVMAQTLFEGEWKPRTHSQYAFKLRAPLGPLSYRGELFSVSWCVAARAELAWAQDSTAEREIVLGAWAPGETLPHTGTYRSRPATAPRGYSFGSEPARPQPSPASGQVMGLRLDGGALGLARMVRNAFARLELGRPTIHAPRQARLGERYEIELAPRGQDPLVRVEAHLLAQEVVRLPRGLDRITEAALVHFESVEATCDRGRWHAAFVIPTGAPPTFCSRYADVRWNVELECTAEAGATPSRVELSVIVSPG
jgi:hypothetical protein